MCYSGKARKAMFKELFLSAVQPFITHHSSLSTSGVVGTALVNEKSPYLTFRGCQPAPFCLCAQAELLLWAAGCRPCCVHLLNTAHPDRRTAASPFHQLVRTELFSKSLTLLSWLLPDTNPKVLGKLLYFFTPATVCFSAPACLKEQLELEGDGVKDTSFQLVSSLVSLDQ